MEPIGQNAVAAIENYRAVVSTLQQSLQMALHANVTMSAAMRAIAGVSLSGLATQARTSHDLGLDLQAAIERDRDEAAGEH